MSLTECEPLTERDGRRDPLTAAIQRNGVDLLRFFQRRAHDDAAAADLYGELLLLAVRKKHTLPIDPAACRMFLFGMAKNVLRNHDRGHRRHLAATEKLAHHLAATTRPVSVEETVDAAHDVRAAIAKLPPRQREIVTLIHWDGFTQVEVAQILGIPAATVRSRYARACHHLARTLGQDDAPDSV
jgi:RNA polymerase sigma-70 factor (ECF subfamily)